MRITSLRSKIFLLVGVTLCLGAIAVMLVTQRDVTRTVVASEELAVRNVLNLLVRDSEARWGALLNDKIATVRTGRRQLIELGSTVRSVLNMYVQQVERGELSMAGAQDLAMQWINSLPMEQQRFSFVFNRDLIVLASGNASLRGTDLSALKDFKGRELAASVYEEARTTGQSLAIYRWPLEGKPEQTELRYAYFAYFQPWDWIFAISGNAREVSRQFDQRRQEMETSMGEALESLRLAHSGFAFIATDDGKLIPSLPEEKASPLDTRDQNSGWTLRELLQDIPPNGEIGTITFSPNTSDKQWEISAAYFKPLGWTIVAAVPAEDLTRAAGALRNRLALLFMAVLGISLVSAWALSARITRPLQQLSDYARALPEQDLSTAGPIPRHIERLPQDQPDEVGRLAATFMYMDRQLREKIARLVQETSSRERLESELSIAHAIQMGLLPPPPDSPELAQVDLYATMKPAREVGGDLYDYFLLPDGRLCLAIGDVSDKGIPAALFMAVTRTLIRALAEEETDPALLMERINNSLSENNPNLMFVTLVLAVLNIQTGEMVWANAGHPALCVLQTDGQLRLLEGRSGPACGVQEDLPYRSFSTVLAPGECVFGYTDGVTEALNPDGALYGEERLYALLCRLGSMSCQGLADALLQDVQVYAQGTEQSDDITLIAARRPALPDSGPGHA